MNTETISAKEKYRMALEVLKPFCKKNIPLAVFQAAFIFLAIVGLTVLSYFLYEISIWWSVLMIPGITAFLCRSYVIEHDCGHQSFFRKKSSNAFVGNIFGFMNLIPYEMWKYIHDSHHNHVGNLDKRHLNPELWTMTVNEYNVSSKKKKVLYHMIRSKASRLIFAPWLIFAVIFRIPHKRLDRPALISVIVYDLLYVVVIYFVKSFQFLSKNPCFESLFIYLFVLFVQSF